ncbi:MFS transporter [Brachybacterium huguangmaarense]
MDPVQTSPARGLLPVLCVPMFLVLLDVMAMNVAMPTLGRAFDVPAPAWGHVVDAYTVPLALALLPGGFVVDRVGPRRALLASLVAFAAASMLGALSWTWAVVLIARAGQGLAAALMLPAGLAALSLAWPRPDTRARALGTWSAVSAVATAIGPAVGGLLVAGAGWRAVFWVNVPLVVAALLGTARWLPDRRSAAERGGPRSRRAMIVSVLVAAMMTSGANGTVQVITVHLQSGLGIAPGPAGAILLLATAPFVALGPLSGRLMQRWGRRRVAACGFAVGGACLLTLGRLPGGSAIATLVPGLLGIGLGLGLMTAAVVGETMAAWEARPGLAGGLNNALRQAGTSAGVALGALATAHATGDALLARTGGAAGAWWLLAAALVLLGFERQGARPPGPSD